MSNPFDICDTVIAAFCEAEIFAIRYFLEQARRYSNYKYLSLETFGASLVVSCADSESDTTVINPYYNGRDKEK